MPTMVPRKPYERLLIKTKWLLSSGLASVEASINPDVQVDRLSPSKASVEVSINPGVHVDRLSPSKAARAAMLKTRFAETIFKAKQKKLFEYDPSTILAVKKGKEKLVAAAAVDTEKAKNIARQKQLQRLREKARRDLEMIEANVCVEDSVKTMEELTMLAGCWVSHGFNEAYSLDKLGLRLKDSGSSYDDIEEMILNEEIEEGEIVDQRGLGV